MSYESNRGDLLWFALQTWPRYEKKVAAELQKKTVNVFLPIRKDVRKWSDRQCTIEVPLFPTYLFVQIPDTLETRIPVLRTNGVTNFVGTRGVGSAIPEAEIEGVRSLLDRGIAFDLHPFLSVGQRVRIRSGSLQGIEGILVEKHNDLSLVVSVRMIQRSLSVRVSGYQIEAA